MTRRYHYDLAGSLIVFVAWAAAAAAQAASPDARAVAQAQAPRYILTFDLVEYSIFHGAAVAGLQKYAGEAEFSTRLVRQENTFAAMITIRNAKLLEAWSLWMKERTADIIQNAADVDKLDEPTKLALKAAKSIQTKLDAAKANPVYDLFAIAGKLVHNSEKWMCVTDLGPLELAGEKVKLLEPLAGADVVVSGFLTSPQRMDLKGFIKIRSNTLDLFVMSHCPYGQQAEYSILRHLASLPAGAARPAVDIHYLFYKQPAAPGPAAAPSFTSLHGEAEIDENVIQIIIRDHYPKHFFDYVLARAASRAEFESLAKSAGIAEADIDAIKKRAAAERAAIIENEYHIVAGAFGVLDGSPTFYWESRRVDDPRQLKAFAGLPIASPPAGGQK